MRKRMIFLAALVLAISFLNLAYGEETVLRVFGTPDMVYEGNEAFEKMHPDVKIEVREYYQMAPQEMGQAMLTQDEGYDLYAVKYAYGGFETLMEKEYVVDLAVNEEIAKKVSGMYPYLRTAVQKGTLLAGVPIAVTGTNLGYYPKNMEAVGLDKDNLPQTFEDWIDLARWWEEEGREKNPDYVFVRGTDNYKNLVLKQMIDNFVQSATAENQIPNFTSKGFLKALVALEALDDTGIQEELGAEEWGFIDNALFDGGMNWTDFRNLGVSEDWEILPLGFEGIKAKYAMDITVLFINPNTTKTQLCFDYMITYMDGMAEDEKMLINMGTYEGVERANYENSLKETQDEIDQLEIELEIALETDQGAIEERLYKLRNNLKRLTEDRWDISPASIKNYQNLVEKDELFVKSQGILTDLINENQEYEKLTNMFLQGQQDAQNLAQELNRITNMMILENQ